ncbi:MAG TPA: ATP-binding protein [Candidatus Angelobacter sp.]|nr:ATP-binding protein [Candidatus Angelobacter sp.]
MPDRSLIAIERFIEATRESGYKGTGSAVSELVDNAIEAGARRIAVTVDAEREEGALVEVLDNGSGMTPEILCEALRFGGSTRFGSRAGLGRYGMGLPNSSVSQTKKFEVVTWQHPEHAYRTYLDIDEIVAGTLRSIPLPKSCPVPIDALHKGFRSGTLVRWLNCDRLEYRRTPTLIEKLRSQLGRVFRHFIWKRVELTVNGARVPAVDPLLLNRGNERHTATQFGSPLEFDLRLSVPGKPDAEASGHVTVLFSILPVAEWHNLSNEEKREKGISKGAGMSIVRAGREVDYGWWFFGDKRKENYDDWWRAELRFEPTLDEAFGITHTKQQIRPTSELFTALVPDIEATAKALNREVRIAHEKLKFAGAAKPAENIAANRERLLPNLQAVNTAKDKSLDKFAKTHPQLLASENGTNAHPEYSLVADSLKDARLFRTLRKGGKIVAILNTEHAFYKRVYLPLSESPEPSQQRLKQHLDLVLLAAARAECGKNKTVDDFLANWSNILHTFLS